MADILSVIFPCITRRKPWLSNFNKTSLFQYDEKNTHVSCEEAADRIVNAFFEANEGGPALLAHMDGIARQAGGWSQWLAEQIRKGMEVALKAGKEMNAALAAAYDKACEAATVFEHFAKDHPLATEIFITVIAIGVLAILAPYVIEILGFGEFGPIEGELASAFRYIMVGGVWALIIM